MLKIMIYLIYFRPPEISTGNLYDQKRDPEFIIPNNLKDSIKLFSESKAVKKLLENKYKAIYL